jgi:L-aminopeptidase/D-esterase-like protein
VYAGWHALNGAGEMTGTTWLDASGFHITQQHAMQALRTASGGPVTEGPVGGGTGMMCHEFKGGVGTSSRKVGAYTVGVLVQCNYGRRADLVIAGVPVGREPTGGRAIFGASRSDPFDDPGSIIVVVATDAPFLPHQLKRLAQRPSLALGRMGSSASNGSGDIFIAFSTASEQAWTNGPANVETLPNDALGAFFLATVQATEEAIVNALVAGREMAGAGGRLFGIPHDELRAVLQRFGRLRQ